MIIFCFDPYKDLAKELLSPKNKPGEFLINRFSNQELFITLQTEVQNKDCLIIGTITPPDENLLITLMLAHTLKKEGAQSVTFFSPYLSYARQDKNRPKESLGTRMIGKILKSAGVDKVITFDVHSKNTVKLFPMPLISISTASVLASEIQRISWQDATLFAPDEGSLNRYKKIKSEANMKHPMAYLKKVRNHNGVFHQEIIGTVTPKVIVIDDMLDTGGTLVSCCQILKDKGAKEVIVMVTHGLFTGDKWGKLWDLGVKEIYCTDSIPQTKTLGHKIKVVSNLSLALKYFKQL